VTLSRLSLLYCTSGIGKVSGIDERPRRQEGGVVGSSQHCYKGLGSYQAAEYGKQGKQVVVDFLKTTVLRGSKLRNMISKGSREWLTLLKSTGFRS
jgi:hypothetical protein